jgi:hypothetical protein
VEASVEALVARMMAKSPLQRFGAMVEVSTELEGLMRANGFRVDRRALKKFLDDPAGYTTSRSSADQDDARVGRGRGFLGRFGRGDVPAIEAGAGKPAEPKALDPTLDYRVTLLEIDRELETSETFALKLSMRLKAPLPRMRSLAARTPCVLVDRLPYKKARWLESVVKELGGKARLDAIRDGTRVDAPPPAAPEPEAPRAAPPKPDKPKPSRRAPTGAVICPNCGWEEDAHARFCSMCRHNFNKTDKIDVRSLRQPGFENPFDNPLMHGEAAPAPDGLRGSILARVPAPLLIGAGLVLFILPLLIALARR